MRLFRVKSKRSLPVRQKLQSAEECLVLEVQHIKVVLVPWCEQRHSPHLPLDVCSTR